MIKVPEPLSMLMSSLFFSCTEAGVGLPRCSTTTRSGGNATTTSADRVAAAFDRAAAAVTSRIKLATGICLVVQRDPIHTAKQVASIDRISHGRFLFGVGGGIVLPTDRQTQDYLLCEECEDVLNRGSHFKERLTRWIDTETGVVDEQNRGEDGHQPGDRKCKKFVGIPSPWLSTTILNTTNQGIARANRSCES